MRSDFQYCELRYGELLGYGLKTLQMDDLMEIARTEGIDIIYQPFNSGNEVYCCFPKPTLILKDDLPEEKMWFFLGHGLGHHFLHGHRVGPREAFVQEEMFDLFNDFNKVIETEAHNFSVSTFLPNSVIFSFLQKNDGNPEKTLLDLEAYTKEQLKIETISKKGLKNIRDRLSAFFMHNILYNDKEDLGYHHWCSDNFCIKQKES